MTTLETHLVQGEIILMDGGTGTELERRGVPMNDQAWSVATVKTHPDVVRQIHEDYIKAGADIIITNTYATSRHHLQAVGLGEYFQEVNAQAAALAHQARDNVADRPVFVAGSMSTSAFFRQRPPLEEAKKNFEDQADILAEGGIDFIVLEMMRDVTYTPVILQAALRTGLPVWAGFSSEIAEDGSVMLHLNEDDTLAEGIASIDGQACALMSIMHTLTEDTIPSLTVLKDHWSGYLGAYPHSGKFIMPNWQFIDIISPEDYAVEALKWVDMGVQVVGGCCGIGPEHIQKLKETLPSHLPKSA